MDTEKAINQDSVPVADEAFYPHADLTKAVIGAAFEVHREMGSGFLEKVYQTALAYELRRLGLTVEPEAEMPVRYKGGVVGIYYADLVIESNVICEIKAIARWAPEHEAQILHYLKATGIKVGLLLNFGTPRLQIKRMIL